MPAYSILLLGIVLSAIALVYEIRSIRNTKRKSNEGKKFRKQGDMVKGKDKDGGRNEPHVFIS